MANTEQKPVSPVHSVRSLQKGVGPVLRQIVRRAGDGSQRAKPKEVAGLFCWREQPMMPAGLLADVAGRTPQHEPPIPFEALGLLSIKVVKNISF